MESQIPYLPTAMRQLNAIVVTQQENGEKIFHTTADIYFKQRIMKKEESSRKPGMPAIAAAPGHLSSGGAHFNVYNKNNAVAHSKRRSKTAGVIPTSHSEGGIDASGKTPRLASITKVRPSPKNVAVKKRKTFTTSMWCTPKRMKVDGTISIRSSENKPPSMMEMPKPALTKETLEQQIKNHEFALSADLSQP
jgi:hypothetical protein